jgi:hypothetical protein
MERIDYLEACKGENGLLKSIAQGLYWYASQDFSDGRSFDSPEVQAKKAAAVLADYESAIAAFGDVSLLTKEHCGDGSYVDVMSRMMLLRISIDSKFMTAITKPQTHAPTAKAQALEPEPTEVEQQEPDEPLSGPEKLKRAKLEVAGLL